MYHISGGGGSDTQKNVAECAREYYLRTMPASDQRRKWQIREWERPADGPCALWNRFAGLRKKTRNENEQVIGGDVIRTNLR